MKFSNQLKGSFSASGECHLHATWRRKCVESSRQEYSFFLCTLIVILPGGSVLLEVQRKLILDYLFVCSPLQFETYLTWNSRKASLAEGLRVTSKWTVICPFVYNLNLSCLWLQIIISQLLFLGPCLRFFKCGNKLFCSSNILGGSVPGNIFPLYRRLFKRRFLARVIGVNEWRWRICLDCDTSMSMLSRVFASWCVFSGRQVQYCLLIVAAVGLFFSVVAR